MAANIDLAVCSAEHVESGEDSGVVGNNEAPSLISKWYL